MNKEHFSVGDLAKLFNLNTQTLRFYDKINLFKPAYINPKNSYRFYTLEQFEKLTMINYLRSLDMPIEDIKDFFLEEKGKNLINFLQEEIRKTENKIRNFSNIKLRLEEELLIAKHRENFNIIDVHYFKERMVAFHLLNSANLQETHQAFSALDKKYSSLDNKRFGTIIGESSLKREKYQFHSTFLFIEDPNKLEGIPYFLTEGEYLCTVSTGSKEEQEKSFGKIMEYIKENNLEIAGDGLMIMLSHNHTKNSKILFEIQIPIKNREVL